MNIDLLLLIGSILLFVSLLAEKTSRRFGIPTLLLFLLVGMIAGSDGAGIEFDNPVAAQIIGTIALNIILFTGGMDTKQEEIKPILVQGLILSTLGVLLTALLTGFFIYFITNNFAFSITFSVIESLLLASVMSSTDSASVFNILRSKNLSLKENLKPMLEFESGSNDPMAYLLTIAFLSLIQNPQSSIWNMIWLFVMQFIIGAAAGYLLGRFFIWRLNKINLDNDALASILLISYMFFIFSLTNILKGNGYLAVYIGGLVIGNHKFIHKRSITKFFDGLTWLFQIIIFLILGLLVNPSELLPVAGIGLIVGVFMIVIGRPISIYLSLLPFKRMTKRAKVYISWVGLRGAVPIIFATYPWVAEIPHAKTMFNIVFFVTIVSLLIQGTTVPIMAKWLHLSKKKNNAKRLKEFDVEFSSDIKSAMSEVTMTEDIFKHGHRIMDIPLPDNTLVVMVKRKGQYFIPKGNTKLEVDDVLLLISDNDEALQETYKQLGEKKI
ncbi:MAG: potassium/proton antiporter [Bacteroidales bacterium]|jgi:cell volume regulation protein A|nr:potassium/proton antiporter [Bacteroidales bacterium]